MLQSLNRQSATVWIGRSEGLVDNGEAFLWWSLGARKLDMEQLCKDPCSIIGPMLILGGRKSQ
jgi:hypothetical protein